jgi:hypothetical protein
MMHPMPYRSISQLTQHNYLLSLVAESLTRDFLRVDPGFLFAEKIMWKPEFPFVCRIFVFLKINSL